MTTILEWAKGEIDEDAFSPEQVQQLHWMLNHMAPVLGVEYAPRGNWPWQPGHPWRYRTGRMLFRFGYRLMHGRCISSPSKPSGVG